jgi:hypothetical protein
VRGGRALCAAIAAALLLPATAVAGSLPTVSSGPLPGPPLLYGSPPSAPQLSVSAPFHAAPLLVSGTDALRAGEYLYQDYLFDDHGANTVPALGSQPAGAGSFSPSGGDVKYPTGARYANNAADIVELRVAPTADAIVYRVTLNTVIDPNTTVVGIGIDSDQSGAAVAWPRGAGITSPGLDHFITAWGTGGQVTDFTDTEALSGAVTIDTTTNQMTIRVPRSALGNKMDPGRAVWRLVAGAGLFTGDTTTGGDAWKDAQAGSPTADAPGSSGTSAAPGVLNLAFRFDEPQQGPFPAPDFDTGPGVGSFYEDKQAKVLASGTSGDFHADVNFGALADGGTQDLHAPGATQARIFASGLDLPEGVKSKFPEFGGRLQPYLLRVPPGLHPDRPAGLTFAMHSLGGTYTQYAVFSPHQLTQFGDERKNLVVTPLGHGSDGWYTDEGEADFFEVWRDVAHQFALDPERVYPSGYSMGGYGTYKLGVEYPDLFARAFTTVGPPGNGIWPVVTPPVPGGQSSLTEPLLGNVRWLPYLNWVGNQDELVPYIGPTAQQNRFDALKLRSELWTFQGDHFTLAILDGWNAARDFLGQAKVLRDPSRVVYGFFPDADRLALGLRHDHAYWASELRARDTSGNPASDPATGRIDARSLAFGEGDPETAGVARVDPGPPAPAIVRGTRWTGIPAQAAKNELDVTLENLKHARLDGSRARLDGSKRLTVHLDSDGSGQLRLDLPLPDGAHVERVEGGPVTASRGRAVRASAPEASLDANGVTFSVASGARTYVIDSAVASAGGGDDSGDGSEPPAQHADSSGSGETSAGGGGSLPFTGLALGLPLLLGLLLAIGGRSMRRRFG